MFPASVIVPVYNGAPTLGACLGALAQQTVPRASYDVIVVDDGSTDGSAAIAAQHGARVLCQEHAGPAAARNRGAAARGAVLLFTAADCEPRPDWIEAMLAPFADPAVSGVKGVYRTRQRSVVARFAQAEYEEKYARLARPVPTRRAAGRLAAGLSALAFLSSLPLMAHVRRQGWAVGLAAPALALLRAAALDLGLAWGLLDRPARRGKGGPRP